MHTVRSNKTRIKAKLNFFANFFIPGRVVFNSKLYLNPLHATGPFYTSWKNQKTSSFLIFSGSIVIDSHMKWVKESLEKRIPALKSAYHTIFSIKEAKPVTKNAKGTAIYSKTMELQYQQEWHARKFLHKSLLNSACLWSRARLATNKKQKYLSLPDHQYAENLIKANF